MREVSPDRLNKDARRVLEHPFWISELKTEEPYVRTHDDHDGTFKGKIRVTIDKMGDVWVGIDHLPSLRFRTPGGGGMSQRTRNALLILALAIKLDNEQIPQSEPSP
jgi:hypothetical protein